MYSSFPRNSSAIVDLSRVCVGRYALEVVPQRAGGTEVLTKAGARDTNVDCRDGTVWIARQ